MSIPDEKPTRTFMNVRIGFLGLFIIFIQQPFTTYSAGTVYLLVSKRTIENALPGHSCIWLSRRDTAERAKGRSILAEPFTHRGFFTMNMVAIIGFTMFIQQVVQFEIVEDLRYRNENTPANPTYS